MKLVPELAPESDACAETRTPGSVDLSRPLGATCPHCGSAAKHGERIGCCSGCKTLFTSMSAFDRHRRNLACLDPQEAGLEPKTLKTDPSVIAWGWPAGTGNFTRDAE